MNPTLPETFIARKRAASRLRLADGVLLVFAIATLLLGHGVERFESAVGTEVQIFVSVSMALLFIGQAWRLYIEYEADGFSWNSLTSERKLVLGVHVLWFVMLPLVALTPIRPIVTQPSTFERLLFWSEFMLTVRLFATLFAIIRLVIQERSNPAFVFVVSFFLLIATGTLLLMLPVCWIQKEGNLTEESAPALVALFTATSASCVTGLVVVDTGTSWTRTGQGVILALIQAGGLGVMTFGGFFALGQRRSFLVRESVFLGKLLDADDATAVRSLIRSIFVFTFISEALGAIVLYSMAPAGPTGDRVWFGVFHSVSAFCNAGFGLLPKNLEGYGHTWQVWGGVASLIIVGGLGFDVLRNTTTYIASQLGTKFAPDLARRYIPMTRLTATSRLVLWTTGILLAAGTISLLVLELNNDVNNDKPIGAQIADAWFQSVSCRTAGFNTIDFAKITPGSKLFCIGLMFIGASPGSTGGGIKTVVFAVTVLATATVVTSRERLEVGGRTIPDMTIKRAIAMLGLAISVVLIASLLIVILEDKPELFLDHLFEVTSAFGTVGLSTGVTAALKPASQLVLVLTMFLGRVGPLTMLVALARQRPAPNYEYPTERVTLG